MWKKIMIKAVVLIVIFSVTVLIVDKINNNGYDNVSAEVDAPVLPVIYTEYADMTINRLSGYTQDIDTSLMRESIIPVDDNKQIRILIKDDYDYAESYSYELRNLNGDSLIEEGELGEPSRQDGYRSYNLELRMDLDSGTEYVLVIIAHHDESEYARYYTRVVRLDRQYLAESLAFVAQFNEKTFEINEEKNSPEQSGDMIYSTEEPDNIITENLINSDNGNSTDLSHVNLESDYDLLTWGRLDVDRISEAIPVVREIDEKYALIEMKYIVSSTSEDGVLNYYISEYYNIYYDDALGKIVLQSFDRYQESCFRYNDIDAGKNSVILGINEENNINYMTTEDCRKAAFTVKGQLWLYDYRETTMTNIYGAWENGVTNVREIEQKSDINIISIDDDGNVIFAVYGYISRGNHEGKNGILLTLYNHETAENTELCFIECAAPYGILKKQVGEFTYYDAQTSDFYFMLNNSIMRYNTEDKELVYVAENIPQGYLCISDDMKLAAYPDTDKTDEIKEITIYNFKTGSVSKKTATNGVLYPIGFIGTDFIYGEAATGNISTGTDGNTEIALSTINIVDENGDMIKSYQKDNMLVTEVDIQEDIIYLTRIEATESGTKEAEPDYISYKQEEGNGGVFISSVYDDFEYTKLSLVFPANVYVQNVPREIMTKNKIIETADNLYIDMEGGNSTCYFFSNTGYEKEYLSIGEAVMEAQNKGGIVVDNQGNIIFRQGKAASYNTVAGMFDYMSCDDISESLQACEYMSILASGNEAVYSELAITESWEEAFSLYDGVRGLNISGADLDTALIYLSQGIPFTVMLEDGRYVLVVSYNSTHIRYYDPVLGEEVRTERRNFETSMERGGNIIYTFMFY